MAIAIPLLQLTMPAAASSGIVPYRGVVLDPTTHGTVKLPAATPELTFFGVSGIDGIDKQNEGSYVVAGLTYIESDGSAVVNAGDQIVLVGSTGQGKTGVIGAPATPGTQGNWTARQFIGVAVNRLQVPATANARIELLIRPFTTLCN
jgi:hypothetical protein